MKITKKLTQTEAAKLEIPQNGQRIYRDSEMKGFAVRVTSTGFKSYIVEKKIGGKTYRRVIGATNIYSNEAARIEGQRLLLELSQGKDPKVSKVEQELQSTTLWEIYNAYKRDGDKELRQKTITIYDDVMERCLSDWQYKPIAEITREMVALRLEKVLNEARKRKEAREEKRQNKLKNNRLKKTSIYASSNRNTKNDQVDDLVYNSDKESDESDNNKKPGRALAGQCYRLLRALMNYAQEKFEINTDSIKHLSGKKIWTRNIRRQGVIEDHQLADWFKAVLALKNSTIRDFLIFTCLSGLRKQEALALKWRDVNLPGKYIRIDASRAKNNNEHRLPLSDYLYDLLKARLQANQLASVYVFPSKKNQDGHLKEPKRAMQKVTEQSNVRFMLHDLRRTFVTVAESLGYEAYTLKKLVNHSVGRDVTAGYIITQTKRLQEPMQRITDYILGQAGVDNNKHKQAAML